MSDAEVGVVAIGRNEGERLVRCLDSVVAERLPVVYVDSGSSDGSVARARERGVDVVELDPRTPFTAARARNAGVARLAERHPQLALVQIVDGDCELQPGWIAAASAALAEAPDVAAVCGRRRERAPEASLYNRLVDMEWDTPIGDAESFGGDVLLRLAALHEAGGYDESLIAGEDPELSLRIRRAGHRILRLDREMTVHDVDLHDLGAFLRRSSRAGHAYAEAVYMHGRARERYRVRALASVVLWAGVVPAVALAGALAGWPASLLLLGLHPLLAFRIFRDRVRRGAAPGDAARYALACVLGKFPQLAGALRFAWSRLVRRRASRLIEYKGAVR